MIYSIFSEIIQVLFVGNALRDVAWLLVVRVSGGSQTGPAVQAELSGSVHVFSGLLAGKVVFNRFAQRFDARGRDGAEEELHDVMYAVSQPDKSKNRGKKILENLHLWNVIWPTEIWKLRFH